MNEKCVYCKIEIDINDILFENQCGFCKGYSAWHCLTTVIEKM